MRRGVGLEILTNFPFVDVGQLMTTSCAKVPGPGKKPQSVLTFDSVTPTVTVTSCSRCDTSEIGQIEVVKIIFRIIKQLTYTTAFIYQINLFPPFLI